MFANVGCIDFQRSFRAFQLENFGTSQKIFAFCEPHTDNYDNTKYEAT
jgi:hypothetical protein